VGFVVDKEVLGEVFPSFSVFPVLVSLQRVYSYSCIIWAMYNIPVGGHSSEISSHPIDMNNNNNMVDDAVMTSKLRRKFVRH
jgi:hypothetical protein